jgi:hypothetical protein
MDHALAGNEAKKQLQHDPMMILMPIGISIIVRSRCLCFPRNKQVGVSMEQAYVL